VSEKDFDSATREDTPLISEFRQGSKGDLTALKLDRQIGGFVAP
jgi:hypothetical protein